MSNGLAGQNFELTSQKSSWWVKFSGWQAKYSDWVNWLAGWNGFAKPNPNTTQCRLTRQPVKAKSVYFRVVLEIATPKPKTLWPTFDPFSFLAIFIWLIRDKCIKHNAYYPFISKLVETFTSGFMISNTSFVFGCRWWGGYAWALFSRESLETFASSWLP